MNKEITIILKYLLQFNQARCFLNLVSSNTLIDLSVQSKLQSLRGGTSIQSSIDSIFHSDRQTGSAFTVMTWDLKYNVVWIKFKLCYVVL